MEAKKKVDKAKGAQKQQKTQRKLRIIEIELGITRQTREETERPKKKIVHTEAQKERPRKQRRKSKKQSRQMTNKKSSKQNRNSNICSRATLTKNRRKN